MIKNMLIGIVLTALSAAAGLYMGMSYDRPTAREYTIYRAVTHKSPVGIDTAEIRRIVPYLIIARKNVF